MIQLAVLGAICFHRRAQSNKRLERTPHERASLLSCVGEPLKRNVGLLRIPTDCRLFAYGVST